MGRAGAGVAALLMLVVAVFLLSQSGSRPAHAASLCAETGSPFGPFDIQSYEAEDWLTTYGASLELAGFNALFPELPGFAVPPLEGGPRAAGSDDLVEPYIPPIILKGIAWLESAWMQADSEVPWGEVGPVLVSPDCGYGIMQVTTGMQNISGVPNLEQAMIGGHYAFNVARGARILAEKWNLAPEARPQVGERDPTVVEEWYFAIWGYNGFAFQNHPLNPAYAAWPRLPFSCGPEEDGFGHDRSLYPYQEMLLGCLERPPLGAVVDLSPDSELGPEDPIWEPLEVHLPDLSEPEVAGPLQLDNWNSCALDLDCAAMDIATPNPSHGDPIAPDVAREDVIGSPVLSVSGGDLSLVAVPGDRSSSVLVTISNSGTGVLAWRLAPSAFWLRLSAVQGVSLGSDLGGYSASFTVWADAGLLPPGIHIAQIIVESLYAGGAPGVITVTLQTTAAGLIEATDGTLFALQGGLKRILPDEATFEAFGFSQGDVVPVSDAYLATVSTGHPLPSVLAAGRLIRPPGEAGTAYIMDGGAKREVTSPELLSFCGYGADALATLSEATVNAIPDGPPLTGRPCPRLSFADGTLLQGVDGWLWLVQDGARRQIISDNAFLECGFRWGDVNNLADSLIIQLSVGPSVYGCSDDGSLLMTSDGSMYVVRAGLARYIPDSATFEAAGFDWENVLPVGYLGLPLGEPLLSVLATGRLIQSEAQSAVYVVDQDVKRRIPGPQTLAACGYSLEAVTVLSAAIVDSIPSGPSVEAPDCPLLTFTPGTLLQDPSENVWVTMGSTRKLLSSPEVLAGCGYLIGNVNPVSEAILASLSLGTAVTTCSADGSLLWNSDGKVYVVRAGWKRLVPNPATFEAHGFSWSDVVPVPDDWLLTGSVLLDVTATGWLIQPLGGAAIYVMEAGAKRLINGPAALASCGYDPDAASVLSAATVDALPAGAQLDGPPCPKPSFSDGTLLIGSDGQMWVIQGGQRRWIATVAVISSCGYAWANLNTVADSMIEGLPEGPELLGPPCP